MKSYFLYILYILFNINTSKAQTYQNSLNGVAYKEQNFGDIKGSPYVFENWSTGTVQTTKSIFNNLEIKYSEFEDQVFFKSKDDQTMQFADPVKDFTMSYKENDKQLLVHYRNGYLDVSGLNSKSYFEVLADGKLQLLKKTSKKVKQEIIYGSTESNKSFITTTRYYVGNIEKISLLKKDKKSLLALLADKQSAIESYIKTNDIDFKNDENLVKLINYYNSL